jgi:hypothetical protein
VSHRRRFDAVMARAVGPFLLVSACARPAVVPFVDDVGRACDYEVDERGREHVTCDVDPASVVSCAPGGIAVFHLSQDESPGGALSNCPACLGGGHYDFRLSTCAQVTCMREDDCPLGPSVCTAGICRRDL